MKTQTYSSSRLKHYLKCPKSFALSKEHEPEISSSTQSAMRDGSLFEGYIFGFKKEDEKTLIGRKKQATVDVIREHAEHVAKAFKTPDSSEIYLSHNKADYIVHGYADYIGEIDPEEVLSLTGVLPSHKKYIVDLKYTGSIQRVWDGKSSKSDFLQAVMYSYLWFKMNGELLPFMYFIVDSSIEGKPICRALEVEIIPDDFDWLESLISCVHNDLFFEPNDAPEVCIGGRFDAPCWFIRYCTEGRRIAGGCRKVFFNEID